MDQTERRRGSPFDLPLEILEFIAMNLSLPDYLNFRELCSGVWDLSDCKALKSILSKIQAPENDCLEMRDEHCQFSSCHYITRGHILSAEILESAARSNNYKALVSWLIDHGASFRKVPGGIDRLCCEAYTQGDFERFSWLFSKGAPDPSTFHGPRTPEACRWHLYQLKKALGKGSHGAYAAPLRLSRRRGLSDGLRKPVQRVDFRRRT